MSGLITKLDMITIDEYALPTGEIKKELRLDFSNDTHFITDINKGDSVEVVVTKLQNLIHTILSLNN